MTTMTTMTHDGAAETTTATAPATVEGAPA